MATYAVQLITKQGALCAQTITNRGRAMATVESSSWHDVACVVIVVTANSSMERLKMRATAVSQVFHERGRAMDWLRKLGEDDVHEE
jgi:hypothetical protein